MRGNSTFEDIYKQIFKTIKKEILSEDNLEILGCKSDDLAEYYCDKHCFIPVEINENENDHWEHNKLIKTIRSNKRNPVYQYDGDLEMECESIKLTIPLIENKNTVTIMTSPTQMFTRDAIRTDTGMSISKNSLSYEFEIQGYGFTKTDEEIQKELLDVKNEIIKIIEDKARYIKSQNDLTRNEVINLIEKRKTKIKDDQNKLDRLTQKINIR